jgi:PPK2 family polyphosphate:nucleotide phosphotransferase
MAMNLSDKLAIQPGTKVKLGEFDPDETLGWTKGQKIEKSLRKALARLDDLQYVLFAEKKRSLLIIFQAPDAGGKDGTIRHVMSGVDPQGCRVTSFKSPSDEEAAHDYLWRVHKAVPAAGEIGIFNRSYYEDVLVARVHGLVSKHVWSRRYEQINQFEKYLSENGVRILKFFLHISKKEQKKRFLDRRDEPDKRWKISQSDFNERKFWDDYTAAYEDALTLCNTPEAPWYVIPANRKWFRNLAVSHVILETLESMHMKFPHPSLDNKKIKSE